MAGADADELTAIIREIQDRVRARYPDGNSPDGVSLPDLMPLVRARDAAEAKVASIGTVNPRAPGLASSAIQRVKRLVARALDWHVREQVEFNRGVMSCIQATLTALTDTNRALVELAGRERAARAELEARLADVLPRLLAEARQLADIRTHWIAWRREWEQKQAGNEIAFLRDMAESHASYQLRVSQLESTLRELVKTQHSDFRGAIERQHADFQRELDTAREDIQKRLWDDLARIRLEHEAIIQRELRTVRQRGRAGFQPASGSEPAPAPAHSSVDWLAFAERFRGSEEHIRAKQQLYAARFAGCRSVLDLGCGRGEMLEVLSAAGIPAQGIDVSEECVALCRGKGLRAEQADLFDFLGKGDELFDGIVSAQVIEHLPPLRLPELIRLAHERLNPGGLIALETPNPECLTIFATHFWIDPTHTRPVPSALVAFWLEEAGFGGIEVEYLNPAQESIPALGSLPEDVRKAMFGGLDYAIFARKL